MVYIFDKSLSNKRNIGRELTRVYGIGQHRSMEITASLGVNPRIMCGKLSPIHIKELRDYITSLASQTESKFLIEKSLKRDIKDRINKLINIKNYRGLRHKANLPCRGQRTHTNARTRKRWKL